MCLLVTLTTCTETVKDWENVLLLPWSRISQTGELRSTFSSSNGEHGVKRRMCLWLRGEMAEGSKISLSFKRRKQKRIDWVILMKRRVCRERNFSLILSFWIKRTQSLNINGHANLQGDTLPSWEILASQSRRTWILVIWLGSLWVSLLCEPQCVFFLICKSRLLHKEVSKSSHVHGRKPKETLVRWCASPCLLLLFWKGREVLKMILASTIPKAQQLSAAGV